MERPSKRLRTCPPPPPDEARTCHLDTVPDDILRTVLRHLSRRPQHRNWHAYISTNSVNTALDVGGALKRAALMEFDIIGGEDGIPPGGTLDVTILRPLVYRLPLRRLVLKLREEELLPDLLRGCGAELRDLVLSTESIVVTENDIFAILTYCTKLSSLAIRGGYIESTLTPIWRSLGSTLTRIYIGRYHSDFGNGIVDVISVANLVEHCVNLYHVDVKELSPEVADVLIVLGSRIRVLGIEDPSYTTNSYWGQVYGACTNLEAVHLALYYCAEATDVLSLMSSKLICMTLNTKYGPIPTDNQFFSVLLTCSVLKKSNSMYIILRSRLYPNCSKASNR